MTAKEQYYLEYNKDNIAKNLIQAEEHFRNIDPQAEQVVGFQNCILKHLLNAEAEAEEAISHSLIVEGEEKAKKFQQLRDEIRKLRKRLQKAWVPPEEGIKRVRQLRRKFESFNPEYDISKCRSCGPIIEKGSKLTSTSNIESLINTSNHTFKTESTHVKEGRTHMPKLKGRVFLEDFILGTVSGTIGTALHFMAFQPYGDQLQVPGIKGGALLDIIIGALLIAASQITEGFWRSLLLMIGGTIIGLGIAYAAGWVPAPAPTARLALPKVAIAPTPVKAPTITPVTTTTTTRGITFQ